MVENMMVSTEATLLDAMRNIDKTGNGVCFIVDFDKILRGVLTDGDIRRALIRHCSVDCNVMDICGPNFVYGLQGESFDELLKKTSKSVKVIPIVNKEGRLIDFLKFSNTFYAPISAPHIVGNEINYALDCLLTNWISSQGQYVNNFEEGFASYCGCRYGTAVMNGTVALHLALEALGIGRGDQVIIPDLTFAATVNAVLYTGATPVIVDVEEDSWCIDPECIKRAITPATRAIIPVHTYGQVCNMQAIMDIAKQFDLRVIEDCAEAHGATFNGKMVGSFGDIGCFSFFANKIITTGEGGMCMTNSPELYDKMRILRDHGMSKTKRYWHDEIGYNYRLTNLQAAIGCAQLENITDFLEKRTGIEAMYIRELSGLGKISWQKNIDQHKKVVWLVSGLLDETMDREQFIKDMNEEKVDIRPFFHPLSSMPIYKKFATQFGSPITYKLSARGINFPTLLSENDQFYETVIEKIKRRLY